MGKLLVWLIGAASTVWVVAHFGYWRQYAAFGTLLFAIAWVILGLWMMLRGARRAAEHHAAKLRDAGALRESVRRAEAANRARETVRP